MNTKNIVIGVLAVAVLVFGALYFSALSQLANLGGAGSGKTHYQTENFLQGLYLGTTGQTQILNTGTLSAASSTQGLYHKGSGVLMKGRTNTSCYTISVTGGETSAPATSVATTTCP